MKVSGNTIKKLSLLWALSASGLCPTLAIDMKAMDVSEETLPSGGIKRTRESKDTSKQRVMKKMRGLPDTNSQNSSNSQSTFDHLSVFAGNPFEFQDSLGVLARFCHPRDVGSVACVSKKANENVSFYIQQMIKDLIWNSTDTLAPDILINDQKQFLKDLKATPNAQNILHASLKEYAQGGCVFLSYNSALTPELSLALRETHDMDSAFRLYTQFIDAEMKDEVYTASIAQHILSKFRLFVPKENHKEALENLWHKRSGMFLQHLQSIKDQNNYLAFDPNNLPSNVDSTNYHIVITDQQLANEQNKNTLQAMLQKNSNHRVVLNVGERFVSSSPNNLGKLILQTDQLPSNLKHLIITNTQGNVTSIGRGFLASAMRLTSFDSSGFGNVTSIGDYFLASAMRLTSFDSSGFGNVTSIGVHFLHGARSLTSFDSRGFGNVTSIGANFMHGARSLTSFDSSGFGNVTSIGDYFLTDARSLTSFDSSGFGNVTSIGDYFLASAMRLTSFDSSGFRNVTSIGDGFLPGATSLTSFDSRGFGNVTSIWS